MEKLGLTGPKFVKKNWTLSLSLSIYCSKCKTLMNSALVKYSSFHLLDKNCKGHFSKVSLILF